MAEPTRAEARLCQQLQLNEHEAALFVQALHAGTHARSALVLSPKAAANYEPPFTCLDTSSWAWLPPRVRIPSDASCKPASYPDYEAGLYYLLDLSSCWESAALAEVAQPARSLDLCAAPGGKTMLMYGRYCPREEHVANEIHAARRGILRENAQRCALPHLRITGFRPDQWAQSGEQFGLILADAPCSGQSLLARGIKNVGCMGSGVVNGNAKRQKGILLSALQCLAPNGYLLYTTCTYSPEENEKVILYLLKRYPELRSVAVAALEPYQSRLTTEACYRLLPMHGLGAGGFSCLLHKQP